MTGHEIVERARLWIGTPYVHQQAARGAGCDCLGLLRGLWCDLGHVLPEPIPPYTMDWSETAREERLWEAAKRHLRPKTGPEMPGDVLLFRMVPGAVAKHLGIQATVGPVPTFIHAYCDHGVVENALSRPWARRVVARFTFPQLTREA